MGMFECSADTFPTLGDLVDHGYPVFDDTWTTYVKEYKPVLIEKIIREYRFNEICCPTPDRFRHYINTHLAKIMPYYNQMYASELIRFDPMLNHSLVKNERSIENLLKSTRTEAEKAAKNIRDVSGVTAGITDSIAQTDVKSTDTVDKTVKNVYNKQGTDDSTTDSTSHADEVGHTDKVTEETKQRDVSETTDANVQGNKTVKENETFDGNKNVTANTTKDIVTDTSNEKKQGGTVTDDGAGTSHSEGKKNYTEKLTEVSDTTDTMDLDETTNAAARKDYADTPQIQLSSAAGSDGLGPTGVNWSVRSDYLTNVTWDSSNTTHKLDSTEKIHTNKVSDKAHDETTSDDGNTTAKNTQTTDMTTTDVGKTSTNEKDNTNQTEVTNNTGVKDSNTDTTETTDKNVVTDDHTKTNGMETTDSTKQTDAKGQEVYDDDWTENGNANTIENSVAVGTKNTNAAAKETQNTQTAENAQESSAQNANANENTSRTTDRGLTDMTSGFMNISASELLMKFRNTFLNIDAMIIEELRENFMEVF